MIRGWILTSAALLLLILSCGKAEKRGQSSHEGTPHAGDSGIGGSSTGGSGARGGTAGNSGSDDGGEPSDGGAPTGGRGGTSTSGAGSGGSSSSGAAGSAGTAGAAGVGLPDGCEPISEHVGGTYCSAEMTCDSRRLNVSCTQASAELWTCVCTDPETRVDYEFPDATGAVTCEVAAKACADPSILTGDEECLREHAQGVLGCSLRDTCDRLTEIDGVTLRARRLWNPSCKPCESPSSTCCSCEDEFVVDYRIRDIDLSRGCDFLDDLCPGNFEEVGATTCTTLEESLYPDEICSHSASCGQPVELDGGTRLTLSKQVNTFCYVRPEGFRCTCQNEEGENTLAVDFGMTPATLGPCRSTSAICGGAQPLETTGSRRCVPNTDVVAEGGCLFYVDCTQPATVGGSDVTVYTEIGAQCEKQSDGNFICYCNNQTAGPYEIEAEDSASACPQAIEICPTRSPTL